MERHLQHESSRQRRIMPGFRMLRLAVGLALSLAPCRAPAATLATDDFTYPSGALVGNSGGTGWQYAWLGFNTDVSSNQAVPGVRTDIQAQAVRGFLNPQSTNQIFVAFDLTTPPALQPGDWFVVYFTVGVNSTSLVLGISGPDNRFSVGVGGTTYTTITAQPGTQYHVVGCCDLDFNRNCVWVNPDPADFYDLATGNSSADATMISILAGHSETVYAETIFHGSAFDNLIVADAPSEVGLQSPSAVPGDAQFVGAGRTSSFPNPCSTMARVSFELLRGGRSTMSVWDVRGRRVDAIDLGYRPSGPSEFLWNATGLAPGTYFYRIDSEASPSAAGKCIVQR